MIRTALFSAVTVVDAFTHRPQMHAPHFSKPFHSGKHAMKAKGQKLDLEAEPARPKFEKKLEAGTEEEQGPFGTSTNTLSGMAKPKPWGSDPGSDPDEDARQTNFDTGGTVQINNNGDAFESKMPPSNAGAMSNSKSQGATAAKANGDEGPKPTFFCTNLDHGVELEPGAGSCFQAADTLPKSDGGSDSEKCVIPEGLSSSGNNCNGGGATGNLFTNCSYVINPQANSFGIVLNPFWCFDPTECSHVMQQGFMTGTSDTTENKYCCSKITEACSLANDNEWRDYWCSSKPGIPNANEKCVNVGGASAATKDANLNAKCVASSSHINHCCCDPSICFGGDSLVTLASGDQVPLKTIRKGDAIRTPAGVEEIIGFTHSGRTGARKFMNVKHEFGAFNVSTGHLLFTAAGESILAGDVEVGTQLAAPEGASAVLEIGFVPVTEFMAPLTTSGMLTIGGVHASSYAELPKHSVGQVGTFPQRMANLFANTAADKVGAATVPVSMISA
eukprot:gene240-324_t